jgi:hypothetical protein
VTVFNPLYGPRNRLRRRNSPDPIDPIGWARTFAGALIEGTTSENWCDRTWIETRIDEVEDSNKEGAIACLSGHSVEPPRSFIRLWNGDRHGEMPSALLAITPGPDPKTEPRTEIWIWECAVYA